MKGLMLLMGREEIGEDEWLVATELDRMSSRGIKELTRQGREQLDAERAVRQSETLETRALLHKTANRPPRELAEEVVSNSATLFKVEAIRLYRTGQTEVTPRDLKEKLPQGTVKDWVTYTGFDGTVRAARTKLAKEALDCAVKKDLMEDVSLSSRPKYRLSPHLVAKIACSFVEGAGSGDGASPFERFGGCGISRLEHPPLRYGEVTGENRVFNVSPLPRFPKFWPALS
jgi:hypothetical protein